MNDKNDKLVGCKTKFLPLFPELDRNDYQVVAKRILFSDIP